MKSFEHYFDYKSPYAYLAQQGAFELAEQTGAELHLIPYTLDIPAYLGSARVDGDGQVLEQSRNAHQWRRVKYAYMDCRREANRRGLTIRGPRKIFDSRLAHVAYLFAATSGLTLQRQFHMQVYEKFWRRELDIEDLDVMTAELESVGIDSHGFANFVDRQGYESLAAIQTQAEANGVFGVPSYRIGDQLYWGGERLERVREHLQQD